MPIPVLVSQFISNRFHSAGSTLHLFFLASIQFYWLSLLHCMRLSFVRFGERDEIHRSARLQYWTASLRFGKLTFSIFFSLKLQHSFSHHRFFFIVLTDCSCWAPIMIMKVLAFFSHDISGRYIFTSNSLNWIIQ